MSAHCSGLDSFLSCAQVLCYASTTAAKTAATKLLLHQFLVWECVGVMIAFLLRLFVSPLVSCLLVVGPSVYYCVHFEPLLD